MNYIYKFENTYVKDLEGEDTNEIEYIEFFLKGKREDGTRPRGDYVSIPSEVEFSFPEVLKDANGLPEFNEKKEYQLVENISKRQSSELRDQKLGDAKEYMKAIDNHIDAATTIKQLKDVVKQIVRLLE